MENTKENKFKFLAQYWGQKIKYFNNGNVKYDAIVGEDYHYNNIVNNSDIVYIILNRIENITDEHAILLGWKSSEEFLNMSHVARESTGKYYEFDMLRSLGYFVPYLDLTKEIAINYGWLKFWEKK